MGLSRSAMWPICDQCETRARDIIIPLILGSSNDLVQPIPLPSHSVFLQCYFSHFLSYVDGAGGGPIGFSTYNTTLTNYYISDNIFYVLSFYFRQITIYYIVTVFCFSFTYKMIRPVQQNVKLKMFCFPCSIENQKTKTIQCTSNDAHKSHTFNREELS